jgi:general secretion pathway protein K
MRRHPFTRQRGVAVVTALLLTTLAVTIVTSLFWEQQVQIRSMENQRMHLQTRWILRGALDWARLVLRQDARDHADRTTLNDVWNTPLAETRLDQYIERERVQGETFDATISGKIIDASSRYNLKNLARNRGVVREEVELYRRLLTNLQLDPALAQRTAQAIAATQALDVSAQGQQGQQGQGQPAQAAPIPAAQGSLPIEFSTLNDLLTVEGYTPEMVEKLREFVIVLPEPNPVNVNTAPPELLGAVMEAGTGEGTAMAVARKTAWFKDKADFTSRVNTMTGKTLTTNTYNVRSEWFLVQSRVKLDRAALNAESLIHRKFNGATTLIAIRQN